MAHNSSVDALMDLRPSDVLNIRLAVPFFGVKAIEASLRFYVDGLGFEMTKRWEPEGRIRWCWLELDHVAVMLQEYWKDGRAGGSLAGALGQGCAFASRVPTPLRYITTPR